ncbi:hypothetical protein [Peribacillus sp. AS_2]|uniref:hypothetical protein n=1 Tax=Peribacillus sp. AS_2 TaxID=2996755 RepID=UPI0022A73D14|nr:hypothetical protein [Peribacillus sp. AS_2]MCZ0875635.1 hypothetical protein [Peribacillus sp. AS_2]
MSLEKWVALGRKRILRILDKYRVSSMRHLEIKISEAGPYNQRVEPAPLSIAYRQLKNEGHIIVIKTEPVEIVASAYTYGKPGDKGKLQKFERLYNLHHTYVQKDEICGMQLEKLIFDTALDCRDQYTIFGSGPIDDGGILKKPPGSEILFYNGNASYKGAGLDLFLKHNDTQIPIGIEAKNIREWIYPASYEVWRMIAKAATLECLPVLAARKISFISRAGFFSKVGILGFQTQFQYFNPRVKAASNYKFADVVKKEGLGYADIKITNDIPPFFLSYFQNTLPDNLEEYYQRFMDHREILKEYAIDKGMAEKKMTDGKRYKLYQDLREELEFMDPSFEDPDIADEPAS